MSAKGNTSQIIRVADGSCNIVIVKKSTKKKKDGVGFLPLKVALIQELPKNRARPKLRHGFGPILGPTVPLFFFFSSSFVIYY